MASVRYRRSPVYGRSRHFQSWARAIPVSKEDRTHAHISVGTEEWINKIIRQKKKIQNNKRCMCVVHTAWKILSGQQTTFSEIYS